VSERSLAQQANALISKYVKLYTDRYGEAPVINRYRERWGFQSVIEDLGGQNANRVLEYYFTLKRTNHPVQDFLRSYDELHKWRLADEEDKRRVAQLHEETAKRVKEWQEKHGNRGTSGPRGGV
jgi:hypothetical protein